MPGLQGMSSSLSVPKETAIENKYQFLAVHFSGWKSTNSLRSYFTDGSKLHEQSSAKRNRKLLHRSIGSLCRPRHEIFAAWLLGEIYRPSTRLR
jgi:hypothetical protein